MKTWRDLRTWLVLAALAGLVAALVMPPIARDGETFVTLAVVDITGSMNTHDVHVAGRPGSRLDLVKAGLKRFLADAPCGSRFGLALFTERRSFLLFEPVEVCANFAPVTATINHLDWRMAWQGDSHVATGLFNAIDMAGSVGADLLMFTDGHQAPPLPPSRPPRFTGEPGKVKGIILGTGGRDLSPIPKYDERGHEIGFYDQFDVPQESRVGPPPADASSRPGWHPRNAPWGARMIEGNEHLSSVKEDNLRSLAETTGLVYGHLDNAGTVTGVVQANATRHRVLVQSDVRWIPGSAALLCFFAVYAVLPLWKRWRSRRWLAFLPTHGV
ncbi:vWA domain-containing protein [Marinivivus vitaminiproducens]|uniref:vWA domain-containing protein n=1 Tax=Marinivivus vitaminiproducens TaxID=3035935 RepID=UPI00279C005B|nr:VWA domain-containing protein [Geminicoccaceae bacterium SCSIO 64248]